MSVDFDIDWETLASPPPVELPEPPQRQVRPVSTPPPVEASMASHSPLQEPWRREIVLSGKGVPEAPEAEMALAGAAMFDPAAYVAASVSEEAFLSPVARSVVTAVAHLVREQGSADQISVTDYLRRVPAIDWPWLPSGPRGASVLDVVTMSAVLKCGDDLTSLSFLPLWRSAVLEAWRRRQLLSLAKTLESRIRNQEGDADELHSLVIAAAERAREATPGATDGRSIVDFRVPDSRGPDVLIGDNRYLCRGGSMVIVGPSGMGKSSMDLQAAVCWALGKPFLGIPCSRPLRSLIIQGEDDDGDIGEVFGSLAVAMELTRDDLDELRERIIVIRESTRSGRRFLDALPGMIRRHQPDLVHINPLLSYIGGNVAEQEVTSAFLRDGLNAINAEQRFAYILVHHTNKPASPSDKKGNSKRNWNEHMYQMAGSADIINWARAIITLEPKSDEGKFLIRLAKRGRRAGVTRPEIGSNGVPYPKTVTEIHAEYTKKRGDLGARRDQPLIFWEQTPEDQIESPSTAQAEEAISDCRSAMFNSCPVGENNAVDGIQWQRLTKGTRGVEVSKSYWPKLMKELLSSGRVKSKPTVIAKGGLVYYRER